MMHSWIHQLLEDVKSTITVPKAWNAVIKPRLYLRKADADHQIIIAPATIEIESSAREFDRFAVSVYVMPHIHAKAEDADLALQEQMMVIDACLRRMNLLGGVRQGIMWPVAHWFKQVIFPDAFWLLRSEAEMHRLACIIQPFYWLLDEHIHKTTP